MDVDEFRAHVRTWLPANLDRRTGTAPDPYTPEHVAAHRAIQRRLFDGGLAGLTWPVEYGGAALTAEHQRVFTEESADYVTPDFGILSVTTFGSCVPTMLRHASAGFLTRHVPAVLRGEQLWCQFFSEPAAGSDLAGVRTRAVADGDAWVLTGAKIWSSLAHIADWAMCLARTDWDVPKHRGLTWFAVPTDAPNLTVSRIRQITGDSEFCEEFLDGVVVPDAERIGDVNAGWTVTSTLLVYERGAGRPGAVETPDDPGALAPDLVALAGRAGRLGDERVRERLVHAHVDDFAVRQLKARIATMARLGTVDPGVASYGKLATSTTAAARARTAMDIAGLAGIAWQDDDSAADAFLRAKAPAIAGGTEQMQRNGIAERVLKLPRERAVDLDVPFAEVVRRAGRWPD